MKFSLRSVLFGFLALIASVAVGYSVNITGTNSQSEFSVLRAGYIRLSVTDNITAFSGGGQTSATLLDSAYNRVTVVNAGGDSVKLPACQTGASNAIGLSNTIGLEVLVTNADSADSMNVYPQTGQSINALSANAAYAMAANKTAVFLCGTAGIWYSVLGS